MKIWNFEPNNISEQDFYIFISLRVIRTWHTWWRGLVFAMIAAFFPTPLKKNINYFEFYFVSSIIYHIILCKNMYTLFFLNNRSADWWPFRADYIRLSLISSTSSNRDVFFRRWNIIYIFIKTTINHIAFRIKRFQCGTWFEYRNDFRDFVLKRDVNFPGFRPDFFSSSIFVFSRQHILAGIDYYILYTLFIILYAGHRATVQFPMGWRGTLIGSFSNP